jgi:hypothetical protein
MHMSYYIHEYDVAPTNMSSHARGEEATKATTSCLQAVRELSLKEGTGSMTYQDAQHRRSTQNL